MGFHIPLNFQALVPLIGAALPMMSIICTALFKLKVDHLSMVMISACSWITALNPLCAIFIVGPYRDVILRRNRVSMRSGYVHHIQQVPTITSTMNGNLHSSYYPG